MRISLFDAEIVFAGPNRNAAQRSRSSHRGTHTTKSPGIGNILGLTIMLEVGNINRFVKAGNYSSYCRCVESKRTSNGKKKGANNQKNGNRYLAWAYIEAANFAMRNCPMAQKFFQRKMATSDRVLATKALASKLTRATYYIMRDQVAYDAQKLFR